MFDNLIYCIPVTALAFYNEWIVRHNTHGSLSSSVSVFNSEFFDNNSVFLTIANIVGWAAAVVIGIFWGTYWWLAVPLSIFISYRQGIRRALQIELEQLQILESRGELKDLDGNRMTAHDALHLRIELSKRRSSDKY